MYMYMLIYSASIYSAVLYMHAVMHILAVLWPPSVERPSVHTHELSCGKYMYIYM